MSQISGKWGHVEADATWSGLVRHAKDGVVDFCICDIFLTYSRSQVQIITHNKWITSLFYPSNLKKL